MLELKETTFIPDQSFPINIFLTGAIPVHWHDHMEWIMIKKGQARVQVDDVFVDMKSGEFAMVNPKQLHSAKMLEEGTEIIAIVFNEAIIRNSGLDNTEQLYFTPYLNNELKLPNFLKMNEYSKEISDSVFRLVREYTQKEKGFELIIKSEIFKVFGLAFRNFYQFDQQINLGVRRNYNLSGLLDYLRTSYDQEISLTEAAEMVSLSPNHLCKVFKKVTGKTLTEYMHHLRVNEAERLLLEKDYPISEIAEKVGFGSVTYFGRVFKRIKNMSPSAKRNSVELNNIDHDSELY